MYNILVFPIQHKMTHLVTAVSLLNDLLWKLVFIFSIRGRRGRDLMVVGFTTTYAISAYHH
jgi:hypothetical protein